MEHGRSVAEGGVEIEQRLELLEIDLDRGDRGLGGIGRLGGHGGKAVSDEPDTIRPEPGGRGGAPEADALDIRAGQHRADAGDGAGSRDIDRPDPGVRNRAAEEGRGQRGRNSRSPA